MLRYQSANQAGLSTADVKKLASSLLIKGYIWELERLSRSHFPADQLMMGMMSSRLLYGCNRRHMLLGRGKKSVLTTL
jgi:hypothetical protein